MEKRLPIGTQDFGQLVNNKLFYLDKTQIIYKLINSGVRHYFFGRPRRFGKSLVLSVMKNIFLGNKELFKGLWIYDQCDFEAFPVIHISFAGYVTEDINQYIRENGRIYIGKDEYDLSEFETVDLGLIVQKVSKKYGKQVVVLLDEYDKAVLNNLGNIQKAEHVRQYFQGFYSKIKDSDKYIRFFFLSGLTKLMKMSIFSVLNNLDDISFRGQYIDLLGYTQKELETNFEEEIREIGEEMGMKYEQILKKIKQEYNGFNFGDGKKLLYNPWDINNFLTKKQFGYYWADTGIPSAIREYINTNSIDVKEVLDSIQKDELGVSEIDLRVQDLNDLKASVLFFNAGYFTIKEFVGENAYLLKFPNKETQSVMNEYFLQLTIRNGFNIIKWKEVSNMITNGILTKKEEILNKGVHKLIYEILGASPYEWFNKNPEGWLKTLIGVAIRMNSIYWWGETQNIIGRQDLHIPKDNKVYVVEIKVDSSIEKCIEQIVQNYETHYKQHFDEVIKVAINRDKKSQKLETKIE